MKLYRLSQNINNDYDTYDSCVVCAENEDEARLIHPSEFVTHHDNEHWYGTYSGGPNTGKEYLNDERNWVLRSEVDKITVEYIGEAKEGLAKGVIVASYNAG